MSSTREDCAARLEELARDERFEGRREDLESLAVALRDQADGSWTGIDLVAAFPPEATVTVVHRTFAERLFGIIAGASVFLPVAWTWMSLRSATNAYDDYLASHTQDEIVGQTFLGLWTTGFEDRLTGYHQFAPMALVSLVLILMAMGSIILHRLIAEMNVSREDNAMHEARKDLTGQLVAAQRWLNVRRTDDPRFLEEAIKRSVAELLEAHAATRKGVEELSAAVTTATEALGGVTARASADLGAATSKAAADLGGATTKAAAELGVATTKAASELGGATTKSVDEIGAVSTGLLGRLEPLLEATAAAGRTLSAAADSTAEAQRKVTESTAEAQRKVTESTTDMQAGIAAALTEFGATLGRSSTDLGEQTGSALSSLSGSIEKVASAKDEWAIVLQTGLLANQGSVDSMRGHVEEFVKVLKSNDSTLQALANELRKAADDSKQVLAELRDRAEADGKVPDGGDRTSV